MKAISNPELLSGAYDVHMLAVPDEDAGFAGTHEDITEFALIDVDAGCGIEEKDVALLAVGDLELLHVKLSRTFDFRLEPGVLEEEILPLQLLLCLHRSTDL